MSEQCPRVPDQLQNLIDDDLMSLHDEWQSITFNDVKEAMPEPLETEHGRAVILDPPAGRDRDETRTLVLGLPYQQAWKPSMAIRAEFTRQAVAPDSRMVVLPNNTFGDKYYEMTPGEVQAAAVGNLMPFFEQKVKLLEALNTKGRVDLDGYSLGGMIALGIAGVNSDRWSVGVVNSDEAPNDRRMPKLLQRDYMKSGGWSEQRQAIKDAEIPALKQALNIPKLAIDYARFGLATTDVTNRALHHGMAQENFAQLVRRVYRAHPDAAIKLGNVEGSRVYLPDAFDRHLEVGYVPETSLHTVTYTGEANRLHPTGDNVVAHALMFKHAVELAQAV